MVDNLKLNRYVINGRFLEQRITGTQRYAREIILELDDIAKPGELEIAISKAVKEIPNYRNIRVKQIGRLSGILWEQIEFASYMKKNKCLGINLLNVLPLTYPHGITVIHDVRCKIRPDFAHGFKEKLTNIWHILNYDIAMKSDSRIVTVSNFSKEEIKKCYNECDKEIDIINPSWNHMDALSSDDSIFKKHPEIRKGEYYYSMSTLALNKNFKWILCAAKNNRNLQFVIAGSGKLKKVADETGFAGLDNLTFLGYVTDEEAKSLMANCRAFLFPTLYEGFGMPPLEAVACGAKHILVSDSQCMREVYENTAEYIDPYDYDFVIKMSNYAYTDKSGLLKRYSWKESAIKLYSIIKE